MRKLKDKQDNPEIIYIANRGKRILLSLHGEILEEYVSLWRNICKTNKIIIGEVAG